MNATYIYSLQAATDENDLDALEELLREQQAIGGEVFRVPVERMEAMQAKLAKLNRKATKLGTAPITMTDTGERDDEQTIKHGIRRSVEYAYVTVAGRTPVLNGWAFMATVEHAEAGNVLHMLPAYARPATMAVADFSAFRQTGRICEHCQKVRNRIDTYLVQHEDTSEVKQVGSSCLADFTGVTSPQQVAKWFEALYSWSRWIGGGYNGEPFVPTDHDINGFMATACAVVRNYGYRSIKNAQEQGKPATGSIVRAAYLEGDYYPATSFTVEQEDYDKAKKIIEHVRTVLAPVAKGDYEQNVVTILSAPRLTDRQMGYAASAVVLYDRATAPKAAPKATGKDEHYGTVGHTETFVLKVERIGNWYESRNNFMTRPVNFTDDEGRKFTWFTTSQFDFEVGKTYTFKAKIRDHKDGKFGKSTIIGNARKIVEVPLALA